MSVKQITTHDVREIVGKMIGEIVDGKTAEIADKRIAEIVDGKYAEIRRELHDVARSIVDDRLQSLDLPRRPDNTEILETVKSSFDDMDFVREVHYEDSDDGLRLVIIHDHTPSASAYSAICSRMSDMEHSADRFDMAQLILHESDVLPSYMSGTKLLFERPRDAAGPVPDDRSSSAAPGRLDDPESLDIIKNSFDDMDFVRQVYHRYDADGFMLVIVHDREDFGPAHSVICNRIVKIEDSLHNAFLRNWILHDSEDASPYLDGAKVLFKR